MPVAGNGLRDRGCQNGLSESRLRRPEEGFGVRGAAYEESGDLVIENRKIAKSQDRQMDNLARSVMCPGCGKAGGRLQNKARLLVLCLKCGNVFELIPKKISPRGRGSADAEA